MITRVPHVFTSLLCRHIPIATVLVIVALGFCSRTLAEGTLELGERIYQQRCASCHGDTGQGVKGEYSHSLTGDRSIAQLTKYIDESMPEDDPELCAGEDAEEVARYIYDAFYSPIAQARIRPPRIAVSRLTVRQYRNVVADLIGGFRSEFSLDDQRGLRGEYFKSRRPGRDRVLERMDPEVRFDFGESNPAPDEIDAEGFSARWEGAMIAPETGDYEIIIRTDQAARLWLNDRDEPLIDAWVKSGDETEYRGSIFLVGGRAYPLKLEFTSHDQGVNMEQEGELEPLEAFLELHWELPDRVAEVIPSRHLSPGRPPEVFVAEAPFPPDDRSDGYERGTSISKAWDSAATSAAIEAMGYITEHIDELAGVGKDDDEREEKIRAFCGRLVERAFRRPLTDAQRKLYLDRHFDEAPNMESAVERVVLLALKSPRFLYLGIGSNEPDDYHVASRLSFALWDSLPDERLLEAATAGELTSREQVVRQARRMIDDPRTRSKVRDFLHQWLEVEHVPDLAKNSERFPDFDEALALDLRTSLDLFLDDVVWGEDPDFRRLLASNELYLNGRLAQYYGYDLPADAPFQKVDAAEQQRVGVLTHPYLMSNFAYTDNSSPIHRGVFLARGVLGRALRPPPEAFAPVSPDLHPDLTTRERIALQTEPQSCMSCHSMINPLGFTMENFDAAGRFREKEEDQPIDASGSYELPSGEEITFDGAHELAEFLSGSEEAHRAFAKHLFHYMVKQPILAYGTETPADLRRAFAAHDFNIHELMVEIAAMSALTGLEQTAADADSPPDPSAVSRNDSTDASPRSE